MTKYWKPHLRHYKSKLTYQEQGHQKWFRGTNYLKWLILLDLLILN